MWSLLIVLFLVVIGLHATGYIYKWEMSQYRRRGKPWWQQ